MDHQNVPVVAPDANVSKAQVTQAATEQFDAALTTCIEAHSRGEDFVVLEDSLPVLFGDLLVQHFQRTVVEALGTPIDLTVIDSDDKLYTLVMITKIHPPVQTPSSEVATLDDQVVAVGFRKAPRPMNCWIIFRDAKSKELKEQHPELTVQQISTRCSELWHDLTPQEKQPWKDAAQSAKEEHLRQHPDYKYSPRKPGEKKKRQSRKAKEATAAPTTSAAGKLQATSDIATASAVVGTLGLTGFEGFEGFDAAGNAPAGNWFDFFASEHVLEMATQELVTQNFRNNEAMRQARLQEEFGQFDFEELLTMWEEQQGLAFRDGADGNSTLPVFLEDEY
ncbi:NHP6B Chromatin-associated protein containing the HMG domain [Pyrenophora tritici-repentis]|uniref:Mating type 1-2 protein n=3 Tax=Pyrenophora tritici-repentis TaxID=45151 RepID=A0A2W1E1R8_9PLEO|nr:mating-type protein MAT-2 [Pyrenophora tritici-repentis Pt-1C-BFP]KAA8614922.1 Mating type 1-2 protein [Pyrenophora tritici-repentis]EDU50256.1 mating-type protein MAT-2 [Pyrenophora tritici-repentis Pt-1C-BFP]KAF7564593.1 NHP6B, Chromatin-associated protein containing the HMG domain protein [Pyrenophora tritici-repentis]KAI0589256.1 Mating type 1-2 protein [Pyrenophora tritici-repentis]KAI1511301.1 Mating type 1-2 protein [Pyrenophora tritici-repentis]